MITSSVRGYLLMWLKNHILNTIKQEQIREKYNTQTVEDVYEYAWVKIVAEDLDVQVKKLVNKFPPRLRCVYLEEFYKLKYCSTVVYMVPRA